VTRRSTDVTAKDDRTEILGIPYEPPERDEAVAQYQRRSHAQASHRRVAWSGVRAA
jgi:hypothetical protein